MFYEAIHLLHQLARWWFIK